MRIDITGHHVDVTEALETHTRKAFSCIGERLGIFVHRVHAVLTVEKNLHCCEVQVSTDGKNLFAKSENRSMYIAIDQVADKIRRQLETSKGKRRHASEV